MAKETEHISTDGDSECSDEKLSTICGTGFCAWSRTSQSGPSSRRVSGTNSWRGLIGLCSFFFLDLLCMGMYEFCHMDLSDSAECGSPAGFPSAPQNAELRTAPDPAWVMGQGKHSG